MPASTTVRLAVVSDVHADAAPDSLDTYAHIEMAGALRNEHPMADLIAFVAAHDIQVDHIVCPGDLANKSSDAGKGYGWEKLHALKDAMRASSVIASPGNHDLETMVPSTDPAAHLKTLVPSYPTGDPTTDSTFWSDGFAIRDYGEYRIAVLNSCVDFPAHPGSGCTDEDWADYRTALNRGGFPTDVQIALENQLALLDERPVNILVLHHHPVEHEARSLFKDTYGPMRRGDELVRVLGDHAQAGRWFVVHGHKHVPRLLPAATTSSNSPLMLGAASLAAKLWHPVVTVARNQFHIVTFELEPSATLAPLRGTVRSFMWGFGAGWRASARRNSGLPSQCGFGFVADHRLLASQIRTWLDGRALQFVAWDTLVTDIPALRYQGPADLELLEQGLERNGLQLTWNSDDTPTEVSRVEAGR